jgi:phospholipid-binding lipoprotein MlaA
VIDIASDIGIERHSEDFGQTFGWWGAGPGPYLVLPLLGPSSLRDATGIGVRFVLDPLFTTPRGVSWGLSAVYLVDVRARLLGAEQVVEQAALDRYRFVRSGFLQRRTYAIHDGRPPALPENDE